MKVLLLNDNQIKQKINRIAYQIYEDNYMEKELIFAGIANKGFVLAQRLAEMTKKIMPTKIHLIKIKIDKEKAKALNDKNDLNIISKNKVVILIDDVLNTGSTITCGLHFLLNVPVKKIRTAILVDRNHKVYPVAADFVGLTLATTLQEHITVMFSEAKGKDKVYLS